MLLQLPAPDPQHTALLNDLREQHDQLSKALAAAELKAAALIVHGVWGTDASGVLLDMQISDSGSEAANADVLLVLGDDGEVLWFNPHAHHDAYNHPAAAHLEVDDHGNPLPLVDEAVVNEICEHLEEAYEAAGYECIGALDVGEDNHLIGDGINLLFLDVDEALA